MTSNYTEKVFSKQWFISYTFIVLGSFILAAGYVFFINPYRIVPGGVYGISIVVHDLTKGLFQFAPDGIPVGTFGLLLNIPLTITGVRVLGPKFGVKTIVGMVLCSIFMDALTYFIGEKDPLGLKNDMLLACVFGGVISGFGLGLIFKAKATSGGSDIVAMIIEKYTRLPLGRLMIYVDSCIVLIGLLVFRDWRIPLYSWIVIFITGKVIDVTLEGTTYYKAMFVISDKYEEIRQMILVELGRGGTRIDAKGMFKESERTMIFTVVNRREFELLKSYIHQIDPNAFVTVMDTHEIFGEGFKMIEPTQT